MKKGKIINKNLKGNIIYNIFLLKENIEGEIVKVNVKK